MKIKLCSAGLSSYTGNLGRLAFVNGVSEDFLSRHDAERLGASVRVECIHVPTLTLDVRQEAVLGEDLNINVKAEGGGTLNLNWFKDNALLPDQNSETLALANVTKADEGIYHCEGDNETGKASSERFVLKTVASKQVKIETTSTEEPKATEPEVEPTQEEVQGLYTQEELEAIADKQGISGLREIAEKHDVKARSIKELIVELLEVKA
ncbi:conserved hypothetical protein [Vibrio coralliirubri]|uniref:immunoglobulin domain-containing protein n=1 Tax=Vibrio coralliirubri TaxID=1516159 RepID=UPI000635C765|nr:immunoglobulin domain-containing protein [Vibrio coralliirubri]CDT52690.1 conserved hypothetical protein [Vibrio coralliirubri]